MKAFTNIQGLLVTLVAMALCGCDHLRFYDAGQAEIAKKASTAINEAEISKSLVPEREAMTTLAKSEQDAVRRDQFGRRDRMLISWLSATDQQQSWNSLDNYVSTRIMELAGTTGPGLIKLIDGNSRVLKSSRGAFNLQAKTLLNETGGIELQCPIQESQQYPKDSTRRLNLMPAYKACKDILESQQKLADSLAVGGLMKSLSDELKEIGADQKKIEIRLKEAKLNYDTSLETLKTKPAGDVTARKSIKDALKNLEDLPSDESLKEIPTDPILKHLVDEGKIVQLEKKRELVRGLLTALDTGKSPESASDDQKNVAAIGALWHSINDQPPPPMTGLLMESEFLRQEINGLQIHINRAKQQIQLKQAKLASMQDELGFILDAEKAKNAYIQVGSCPSPNGYSMYGAWSKASVNCRNLLARRLIGVLNSITFGKAQQELIDYQLIAQGHDAALDSSEVAINQLDSLIRTPITQLSKAYGSGFTPQHIGNLINALGLGAIAAGVN